MISGLISLTSSKIFSVDFMKNNHDDRIIDCDLYNGESRLTVQCTEQQLKNFFYKLKYFMEQNIFEGEDKCSTEAHTITVKLFKDESITASTVKEMQKFLRSMTITDVGFAKKSSTTESNNLFAECGDTQTNSITSQQKNGN